MKTHKLKTTASKTRKWVSSKGTYAELFWTFLINKNIKKVWGLTGQGISYLINYIPTNRIKYLNTLNELQNTWTAQVYGRLTDNVGFSFTTTGPGIATALSAIKNAVCEKNPLVVCSPYDHERTQLDFQSWDIYKIGKTMCTTIYISKPRDFLQQLNEAYTIALTKQTGVLLLIKSDLFLQKVSHPRHQQAKEKEKEPHDHVLSIARTINKELDNKNMLIVLGKGASSRPNKALETFLIKCHVPYITTWNERLILHNSMHCGRMGTLGNHSANYAMFHATHVIIIGDTAACMMNQVFAPMFNVFFLHNDKRLFTISNDKQFKVHQNSQFIMVNEFDTICSLFTFKPNAQWIYQLEQSNHALLTNELAAKPATTKYEKYCKIAASVYSSLDLNIPVTTGVGNHWTCIGKYFDIKDPKLYETQCVWDSIGTGIANGIAMVEALNKPVWVFEGDGGTLWSGSNLLYLLNNRHLPITVTIYINHIYGMIEEYNVESDMDPNAIPLQIKESIPLITHFPNCHIFKKMEEYETYLRANPISTSVRFIFIYLGNDPMDNSVLEININREYIKAIKTDNYEAMINAPEVLKTEYVYF